MFESKYLALLKALIYYKHTIKLCCMLLLPFSLYVGSRNIGLYSMESLFGQFEFKVENEFFSHPVPYRELAPNETIFILVTGSDSFLNNVSLFVNRLKLRSKSIKISKKDSNEHYFVKIYLEEGYENRNVVFPLKNYQPNSDLMFLANSIFETKIDFNLENFFLQRFEQSIFISLKNDFTSITKLCNLLRFYSNIYSHSLGIYYYIPIYNKFIKHDSFVLFLILSFIISFVEYGFEFNLYQTLLITSFFYLCPLTSLFTVNSKQKHILTLLFLPINFNFALIFAILGSFLEVVKNFFLLYKT